MNKLKSLIINKFINILFELISLNRIEHWVRKYVISKTFTFNDSKINYFFHSYNNFGITERAIEIPIIKKYLAEKEYQNVLEIGNVTKHYYDDFKNFVQKKTLDKYEKAFDVINKDIKDFSSDTKFDFIYSISTFEHMDTDGNRNSDYIKDFGGFKSNAFNYIDKVYKNLLITGGKFVLTFPLSYCNDEIATSFLEGDLDKILATNYHFNIFKKISETEWTEITLNDYLVIKNRSNFPNVNFLVVLELNK